MADSVGWKTAELQVETLVPGILIVLGIDASLARHTELVVRPPVADDSLVQAALFVATAYAAGVLGALLCRASLDRISEWRMRAVVFSWCAHVSRQALEADRRNVDKDRFEADYAFEKDVRKRCEERAFWNAAYRSVLRTTSRVADVDRRGSQGRVLRNLALPSAVWATVAFPGTSPWYGLAAVVASVLVFLIWVLPYAYAEYVNFAEAYDISVSRRVAT